MERPQSCPSRSAPTTGAITARQAEKYFTCHVEKGESFDGNMGSMNLVTDLKIEVARKPRRATTADIYRAATSGTPNSLNTDRPVYDLRGSYNNYFCSRYTKQVQEKQNCHMSNFPNSQGICFQNNFGDWFCLLTGSRKVISQNAPPPQ
jgi:hypothetical protein